MQVWSLFLWQLSARNWCANGGCCSSWLWLWGNCSATGPDGVLFVFLYRFVPGIAWVRGPGRFGLIYTFAIITAAGLVWE